MEKFERPKIYFLKEVFTYGITHGKFGGCNVPIVFEEGAEVLRDLKELSVRKKAELPLYGMEKNKLYLTRDQLSEKQKEELLGKGKIIISVKFYVVGLCKKRNGKNGLKLVLDGMKKIKVPEKELNPIPEDDWDEP